MRRAVVLCNGDTILPEHLGNALQEGAAASAENTSAQIPASGQPNSNLFSEHFLEQYSRDEVLEKLSASEQRRLLDSLGALEARLASILRDKRPGPPVGLCLKDTEAETIRRALEQHRWNITETAKVLGIGRNTLYRKIKHFHLVNS
jgi:two-component system NtrC family response regulator